MDNQKMKKERKIKQGSREWEYEKLSRIGSSEVFDIVRYYATEDELQNCGINAEDLRAEKPYTTAWALYHKIQRDGIFDRGSLAPELADYGHAVEPYGVRILQQGRKLKLKAGEVYLAERLIASLDISGISEEIDEHPYDYGNGSVKSGLKFVCEQKTIMPLVLKKGLPLKYILQAQYQITMTKADFYILQIMVLNEEETKGALLAFERGKITQMSKSTMYKYLAGEMSVTHLYFANNEHLAMLIKTCLDRFFTDVDNYNEPTPFIEYDSKQQIIESIRINTHYNKDFVLALELDEYMTARNESKLAKEKQDLILQGIIEKAKEFNACKFVSSDGTTASFSKSGAFLTKPPKE